MTAATLWAEVVTRYDASALVTLTNRTDRSATTVNTSVGEAAAQAVLNYWPVYAQAVFDDTDGTEVEVAVAGVIAVLWRWGGTATGSARVKWDEVFAEGGMIERVRRTGARSRQGPTSNSGVVSSREAVNGRPVLGWADKANLPHGILPSDRSAYRDRW